MPNDLILFHYNSSPYARRVVWYLTLRGIPYAQCFQPPVLPRPDLSALGVQYRRIPLLSHGANIYTDTRLILSHLESAFPPSSTHPALSSPSSAGLSALLSTFTIDAGVFGRAAQLLPLHLPAMNDTTFLKDREAFTGRPWTKAAMERAQPEAMAHMRRIFDVVEMLLQDGRMWIAGTDTVALADIEAVWPFEWLSELKALPKELFGESVYPRTVAWVARFKEEFKKTKAKASKPVTIKGPQAVEAISGAKVGKMGGVDGGDPTGLKEGQEVEVWPIDSGFSHKDRGRLVTLTKDEVAIAVQTKEGKQVYVHAPRWGFRIAAVGSSKL